MEEVALRNFLCKEIGSLSKHNGHGMENIALQKVTLHSLNYFTFHSLKHLTFMFFNMDEVILNGIRGYKQAEGGILPK